MRYLSVLALLIISTGCAAGTEPPPPPILQLDPQKVARAISGLEHDTQAIAAHVIAIEKKLGIKYPKEDKK